MKVTISIDQQSKSGFLSGTTHSYKMNVQFKLNDNERKVFNDHPLFQDMVVLKYLVGKKKDYEAVVTAKQVYESKPITIEAFGINDIIDYRNEINSAAEKFVNYLNILTDILGAKEVTYGEG